MPLTVEVFSNLYHVTHMVAHMLPLSMPQQRSVSFTGLCHWAIVAPTAAHPSP